VVKESAVSSTEGEQEIASHGKVCVKEENLRELTDGGGLKNGRGESTNRAVGARRSQALCRSYLASCMMHVHFAYNPHFAEEVVRAPPRA